jgi:hypothetical protein
VTRPRFPRLLCGLALAAAAFACKGSSDGGVLGAAGGPGGDPAPRAFSAFDLEGTWRGWS